MPRGSASISSFASAPSTRKARTSSKGASFRHSRWKQNIFPLTRYDGRPSSSSFAVPGSASASSSSCFMVAMTGVLYALGADQHRRAVAALEPVDELVERPARVLARPHLVAQDNRRIPTAPGIRSSFEQPRNAAVCAQEHDDRQEGDEREHQQIA